jgi:hypothetical protein
MSSRLQEALTQVRFARTYSLNLIDSFAPDDWFRMPPGGVTHLTWQVGHLAMAVFRLGMERVRGPLPDDHELMPPDFLALFVRDTVPDTDTARYPAPAVIRATYDRAHDRFQADLAGWPDADLDAPPLTPHKLCTTKIECLRWCSAHEMLHAGQIGLLRRLLGRPPQW